MDAVESVATLINSPRENIYLHFPDVQQQTDSFSCGLFALAYAYSLCKGKNPCKFNTMKLLFVVITSRAFSRVLLPLLK